MTPGKSNSLLVKIKFLKVKLASLDGSSPPQLEEEKADDESEPFEWQKIRALHTHGMKPFHLPFPQTDTISSSAE